MPALALFAPALRACAVVTKDEVPALSHIRVEPHDGLFRYVATDGHILLAVEAPGALEILMGLESAQHRLHIPAAALSELIGSIRQTELTVETDSFLVDPGFPNYRKLVGPLKDKEPIGCLSLGTAVNKKLVRIAEYLGASGIRLQSMGDNQACSLEIRLGEVTAYGLVMPVTTRGEWAAPAEIASWFEEPDQAAS